MNRIITLIGIVIVTAISTMACDQEPPGPGDTVLSFIDLARAEGSGSPSISEALRVIERVHRDFVLCSCTDRDQWIAEGLDEWRAAADEIGDGWRADWRELLEEVGLAGVTEVPREEVLVREEFFTEVPREEIFTYDREMYGPPEATVTVWNGEDAVAVYLVVQEGRWRIDILDHLEYRLRGGRGP